MQAQLPRKGTKKNINTQIRHQKYVQNTLHSIYFYTLISQCQIFNYLIFTIFYDLLFYSSSHNLLVDI